jgi:hypothetical protein
MTDIITKIEDLFSPEVKAVEAFANVVKVDVINWVRQEEIIVLHEAQDAWAGIKPLLTSIPASQLGILKGLVQTAAKDAAAGDYTAIATAVIQQATTAELAWVAQLGAGFIAVWAGIWGQVKATA